MFEPFLAPLFGGLVLTLAFTLGKHFWPFGERHQRRWISLAAGVSVSYVFIDLLPELAERQAAFAKALGENVLFAEKRLYLVALLGFVIFSGLEYMVLRSRRQEEGEDLAGTIDSIFWIHIGGFTLYCWTIGYLLADLAERGAFSLWLYVFAMTLHFIVVDHELRSEHKQAYDRLGRWLLAAAVLVGTFVSLAAPLSEVNFSRLLALVGGGVVLGGAKSELPAEKDSRFWWFFLGAAFYAIVILLI